MGYFLASLRYILGNLRSVLYKILYQKGFNPKNLIGCSINGDLIIRNKGKIYLSSPISIYPGTSVSINGGVVIFGKNLGINRNCIISCHKNITIGENTFIGPNVCIYDHDHKIKDGKVMKNVFIKQEVSIGSNVWIGANSIILKGVKIGNNVIVGAGSIISKNIPDGKKVLQKRESSIFDFRNNSS